MRHLGAGLVGVLLAFAIAVPAAANTTDRFSFSDTLVDSYSCGVVVTTEVVADGSVSFAKDGTWLSTSIRLRYLGEALDPATGQTIELTGRQIVTERPGEVAMRGQGTFIRVAGEGTVLMDVGRLVFDPSSHSTLSASAQVIRFDDPTARARTDAAVCSLFD